VLVNSIVMTYFIGTGRWCKEVSTLTARHAADPPSASSSGVVIDRRGKHVDGARDHRVGRAADPGAGLMAVLKMQPPGIGHGLTCTFSPPAAGLCFYRLCVCAGVNLIYATRR